jgi:hypothetical protein
LLSPIPVFDQTGKGVKRIGDDLLDADDFIRYIEFLLFAKGPEAALTYTCLQCRARATGVQAFASSMV